MKKLKYLLFSLFTFCLLSTSVDALTIRETMDNNDGYSTLEEGSIVIGVTRFSSDVVVTANRAATAGANDAMFYVLQNGVTDGYVSPDVYYYVDSVVGWFYIDGNNKAVAVTDEELLNKLSNLDIYYVDNEEKVLEIDYPYNNIIEDSLPDGVLFKDNKLLVKATTKRIEFMTTEQKKVSYIMDKTTSKFIEDITSCYSVNNGIITDYDPKCGSDIVIPVEINGEEITGIGNNAFKNTGLVSVVIPNTIINIGDNAFANNDLKSVIVKDKYDKNDFSSYGDNVFGDFDKVVYDNELSRIAYYVDSNFVIDYYKHFDIDFFVNNQGFEDILQYYVVYSLMNTFESNGYSREYYYCGVECNYEYRDIFEYEDKYGISLMQLNELQFQISIEKYNKNVVNKVSKIIDVSFNETGKKTDNDIVLEATDNLQIDNRFDYLLGSDNVITRIKYLQDLEDLYDIDIILTRLGGGTLDWENKEVLSNIFGGIAFYLKDGVLYQIENNMEITGENNSYYPSVFVENYDNLDEYVDYVLSLFPEKTGVSNYEIKKNSDGSLYKAGYNWYESGLTYYIKLFDKDYLENWEIVFTDFYDDKYDSNGNTKAECFEFNDGIITDYDGTCGVNVVIPDSIDGVDVTEISNSVFSNMALRSVKLSNTLQKIGDSAFSSNELTEIIIPDYVKKLGYSVFRSNKISNVEFGSGLEEIGGDAFYYNKIKDVEIPSSVKSIGTSAFSYNEIERVVIDDGIETIEEQAFSNNKIISLSLPDSLNYVGGGAFTDNQLSDKDAFIYEKVYDSENDAYVWDETSITSYAGKNRKNIIIPDGVKSIGGYAFSNLGIDEIEIPYGVERLGYYAFANNNLTYVTIPDSVESIRGGTFDGNKFEGENSFIYTRDKDGNVDKSILAMYSNDNSYMLDELVIPSSVKKIWPEAFPYMSLGKLVIPYGVEEIGDYAFSRVRVKENFSLPKSIKKLGKEIFRDNYDIDENDGFIYARNEDGTIDNSILMAYVGNIQDRSLTLPKGIKEIRENVFYSKYDLNEVVLPSSLNIIGEYAFSNTGLNEIIIPSSVKTIEDYAFYSIYNLTKITLNEGLESIGDYAFSNDRYYDKIIIPASVKSMGKTVFGTGVDTIEILGKSSIEDFDNVDSNLSSWASNIIFENYIPKLELPELPFSVNTYGVKGDVRTCEITDIQYQFVKNGKGSFDLKLSFSGRKTFDSNGEDNKNSCGIGVLVDSYNSGVKDLKFDSLIVGNKFSSGMILYGLPAVDTTLTLQDVNE